MDAVNLHEGVFLNVSAPGREARVVEIPWLGRSVVLYNCDCNGEELEHGIRGLAATLNAVDPHLGCKREQDILAGTQRSICKRTPPTSKNWLSKMSPADKESYLDGVSIYSSTDQVGHYLYPERMQVGENPP